MTDAGIVDQIVFFMALLKVVVTFCMEQWDCGKFLGSHLFNSAVHIQLQLGWYEEKGKAPRWGIHDNTNPSCWEDSVSKSGPTFWNCLPLVDQTTIMVQTNIIVDLNLCTSQGARSQMHLNAYKTPLTIYTLRLVIFQKNFVANFHHFAPKKNFFEKNSSQLYMKGCLRFLCFHILNDTKFG